ncbi:MAG: hypothetical protein WC933_03265 [Candidatus Paceibacterota bacterium]|jgi:hypothetical protein
MFILIGGHPKGFEEPFNKSTKSGKVLRKMIGEPTKDVFCYFDLWENQGQQDSGIIDRIVINKLSNFLEKDYTLIALGRFTEKSLGENKIDCTYLPHPASWRKKDVLKLKSSLKKLVSIHKK